MTTKKETPQAQQAWQEAVTTLFGGTSWQQMADDNLARAKNMTEEWRKLEKTGGEQIDRAIDESARLMHESLEYGHRLSTAWRQAAFEAVERSFKLMNPEA